MENLYISLKNLIMEELDSQELGNAPDKNRLSQMRELCHVIMYMQYVDMESTDIMQIFQFYDDI